MVVIQTQQKVKLLTDPLAFEGGSQGRRSHKMILRYGNTNSLGDSSPSTKQQQRQQKQHHYYNRIMMMIVMMLLVARHNNNNNNNNNSNTIMQNVLIILIMVILMIPIVLFKIFSDGKKVLLQKKLHCKRLQHKE